MERFAEEQESIGNSTTEDISQIIENLERLMGGGETKAKPGPQRTIMTHNLTQEDANAHLIHKMRTQVAPEFAAIALKQGSLSPINKG